MSDGWQEQGTNRKEKGGPAEWRPCWVTKDEDGSHTLCYSALGTVQIFPLPAAKQMGQHSVPGDSEEKLDTNHAAFCFNFLCIDASSWGPGAACISQSNAGHYLEWLGRQAFEGKRYTTSKPQATTRARSATPGELLDGQRHGFGRMTFQNGDCYEGGWAQGIRSGAGRLQSAATGDVFVGNFLQGKREGPGTLYMVSGLA